MSATQPASGAHTQRHSLSPCSPPALRHPYVAILPSRRAPDRHAHAVLLDVPFPRIASVRRNPPSPRPVFAIILRALASVIGATVEKLMRTIYFPGLVPPSKTPCPAATLGEGYRGIVAFSTGILDTIEKVASHFPKVTCFIVPLATPAGPSSKCRK